MSKQTSMMDIFNNPLMQKATLNSLTAFAVVAGFKLTDTNVWAGVTVLVIGLALPYLREYLKKK